VKAGEEVLKEYMILPREALYPGIQLSFNIYIHMAINDSLISYCKAGDTLGPAEVKKLMQIPEKNLRIMKSEYVNFLDMQKAKLKDAANAGDLAGPVAKSAATSIMKGLNLNLENSSPGEQAESATALLSDVTKVVSDLILQVKKNPSLSTYEQVLKATTESKDPLTAHNYQVSGMSALIMMSVGAANMDEVVDTGVAGLLHDMGLADISQQLTELHLSGKDMPNPAAMIAYMRHIEIAVEKYTTNKQNISPGARRIIELHHENMDGSGFKGATGGQIYRPARVLRIADDLCILLTNKKKPKTMIESLNFMKECGGVNSGEPIYDTEILDAMIKQLGATT
jgi:HD-GYP domain-containing protein (c-di-GMP phosphodiesterase class II)